MQNKNKHIYITVMSWRFA